MPSTQAFYFVKNFASLNCGMVYMYCGGHVGPRRYQGTMEGWIKVSSGCSELGNICRNDNLNAMVIVTFVHLQSSFMLSNSVVDISYNIR